MSMNGINLNFTDEKARLPVGISKMFGNPDVWDGFEWPSFTESGEEYDLPFVCQINCEQAAAFDTENVLPKNGVLYFFYDMDGLPLEPFGSNRARVFYYDGDMAGLHQMLRTDHEGNDLCLHEVKMHFNSGETPEGVLGQTSPEERQTLLQLRPFQTQKLTIRFPDNGVLNFYIDKAKLARRDFSNVIFEVKR